MIYSVLNRIADTSPISITSAYIVIALLLGAVTALLVPATGIMVIGWFFLGALIGAPVVVLIIMILALAWLIVTDKLGND